MIRIQRVLYKVLLALIFGCFTMPAHAQLSMGAKALAMGQATTALPGYQWSLFSNPALISDAQIAVGFYGLRNYGFSELTDMSAIGTVPAKFGVASLGFHHYGDNIFSETRVRLGYKNDWQLLHFGVALNYNHISFGDDYGAGRALGVDVGIAAELTDDLWIGAKSTNVNKPSYKGIHEDLPRELAIGFSYGLNERAIFAFDIVKDVDFATSYRGGLEISIVEHLKGRMGISTKPLTYAMGFGYGAKRWDVNVAVQKHELLGLSPGVDFMLYF